MTTRIILTLALLTHFKAFSQDFDTVLRYMYQKEIKHAEIVLKQIRLETGNLKCTGCSLDYNNLFGFFYKGSYLKFDSWQESVDYYKRWQDKYYKGGRLLCFPCSDWLCY